MDRGHRLSAERIAIDSQAVAGADRCSKCKRAKPSGEFAWIASTNRRHSWCRNCVRLGTSLRRETPEGKAAVKRYNDSVKARKAAWSAARPVTAAEKRRQSEYWRSERGRIIGRRNMARIRLRGATTDEQRTRIQSLIDGHTAALAALDAEDE